MKLWLEKLRLDLTVNWKLSRNQTTVKENFLVYLETPLGTFRSEIAPNVRYGESTENIQRTFDDWIRAVDLTAIIDLPSLKLAIQGLNLHALSFGIESVLVSFLSRRQNFSITQFLCLPVPQVRETSFSMPIMPVGEITQYLRPLSRFKSLKIKVNAETAVDMLQEIRKETNARLRVDGNEAWTDFDEYLRFQESLKGMNIELIEQPFPSSMAAEYRDLKARTPYKLLADESIEDVGDFAELSRQFHAVNIKLMKAGSLVRARDLLLEAKSHNLEAMLGCMIETTIGISYGMLFTGMVEYVDLDGFLLVKDEPFHLVTEAEGLLKLV
jgi:L-alanine-DL-glutamate epimerase-like enolase superfamily enzyme